LKRKWFKNIFCSADAQVNLLYSGILLIFLRIHHYSVKDSALSLMITAMEA